MTTSRTLLVAGVVAILGCTPAPSHEVPDPLRDYNPDAAAAGDVQDLRSIYRQMGVVSSPPPISFVARPAFFATQSPDTTLMVVSLSLPNRGVTFQHNGPMFRAEYEVTIVLRQNGAEFRRVTALDTIQVATLKETNRTDESIIFRQLLRLPPGQYTIGYVVRDALGGRETSGEEVATIPRFTDVSLSPPVVVYEATPRQGLDGVPQYLPAPRAMVTFGSEATVPVYLEAYGAQTATPLMVVLSGQKGEVLWRDTAQLAQRNGFASGIINIPLARADIGVFTVKVIRTTERESDTVQTRGFIGFGPDLPVVSFDDMVSYLRYFASYEKLSALSEASSATRGTAWFAFLRETDPTPETPQNEALQDYFSRIRDANLRFRTDGPDGWLSDRGSAYVALGEPDIALERQGYWAGYSPTMNARARFLIWEYRDLQARIIFYDETGGGHWRFIPASAANFRSLVARHLR